MRAALALFALCFPERLTGQEVPITTISELTGRIDYGFTYIDAFWELRDGRVLIVDVSDPAVYRAGMNGGSPEQLSRTGQGPREYLFPREILPQLADSVAVVDPANARLLILGPDGQPAYTVRWRAGSGIPAFADSLGNLYSEASPRSIRMVPQDSVPLERWNRVSGRRDTVAWLPITPRPRDAAAQFYPQAQWIVTPGGLLAIALPNPYRVVWIDRDGTRRIRGPAYRTPAVRLTEGHRALYRQEDSRPRPHRVGARGGAMQWTVGKMPPYAPGTWPEFLPPFLTNALFAAPGDMLWIRRAGPAEASPSFDVFGTDGVVTGRVVLPPGRDLLGVGRNGVYLIYRDEWDLQHVERYRLPRIGN